MRRILLSISAVAAAISLATASPVSADHGCNGTITDIAGVAYIDDRGAEGNFWIYVESNGEAGLQSGGSAPTGGYDDTCAHENPDTLVY